MDSKTRTQGRDIQQVQNLADTEAAIWQLQQMLQGDNQRVLTAQPLVGKGEGNVPKIISGKLTEHRLDVRRVGVHIRHHDDHVSRAQSRVCTEAGQ